ncbi:MAG: 30S ribosomal protein S17 [Bacteroidales bacterium]|jgi:small subunit ribosomal protein S17|nr:30S ribosomal protein S17 [Bacteroidales bacterium]MDI9575481.1 30S ribosomal protein S17 [Bacteroidota bacterium]MDD2592845.1 30S ribosomal protein S17 [Bacteroidales bacterium]MDD3755074.1 30S ribosomal protein S17 [Bacteroidales bacterium]MDY0400429.1 30S ribosomal protein S17 [Bacteroidales bacterium]
MEKINKKNRKERTGIVVSNKMDKSVVVRINYHKMHPLYKKYVKKYKKFMAHDENNECNIGDKVRIVETRPLSKHKHWRVVEIIERGK